MTHVVPRVLVLTDRSALPVGRSLLEVVAGALDGGADGILLRERDLPAAERAALAAAIVDRCARGGASAIVAAPAPAPSSAPAGAAVGVHLRRADPVPEERPPLLGRSCHDVAELVRAARDGLDYVTLSPVATTSSKPGHGPPLGMRGVARLIARARSSAGRIPPVLALGGVTPTNAGDWVAAGAHGVAVMGGVMRAGHPAQTVAALVARTRMPGEGAVRR